MSASDKDAWLIAQENNADGAVTLLPPEVAVDLGNGGHIGNVEDACRLSWEILAAAALLAQVTPVVRLLDAYLSQLRMRGFRPNT